MRSAPQRESILEAWLEAASRQPFHREHPDRAVADHIPALFDADRRPARPLGGTGDEAVDAPMDDDAIEASARAHAQIRFEQRLGPVAIATEFRLLRQEIARALQRFLDDDLPVGDIVGAIALVNDAIDGATMLALSALTERIETVREEFLASTIHDVRQPITLIEASLVLASRWIRQTPADVERMADTLDGALYATQEMSQLIDTLADASRVAMGAVDIDPEPVIVRDVVNDALELLDPLSRARIELGRPPARRHRRLGPAGRAADPVEPPDQRPQVLAADLPHPPERASRSATGPRSRSSTRASACCPRSSTSCSGATGGPTTRARAGCPASGLGLYASQGLAVAHGGRIVLESEGRDHGVRARLELPLSGGSD